MKYRWGDDAKLIGEKRKEDCQPRVAVIKEGTFYFNFKYRGSVLRYSAGTCLIMKR